MPWHMLNLEYFCSYPFGRIYSLIPHSHQNLTADLTAFKQANNPPSKALHHTVHSENLKFVWVSHKIDHNSKSIYSTHKIIISPDRGIR